MPRRNRFTPVHLRSRNRFTAVAVAVLVAAGTLATAPASVAGTDTTTTVVTSADFEDGTTGTWTPSGGAGLDVITNPDGAGSVLAITRAADYEGIQSPTEIFQPGVTYTFSMRARLAEPGSTEPAGPTSTGVRFVMKPAYTWIGNTTIGTDMDHRHRHLDRRRRPRRAAGLPRQHRPGRALHDPCGRHHGDHL